MRFDENACIHDHYILRIKFHALTITYYINKKATDDTVREHKSREEWHRSKTIDEEENSMHDQG